MRSPIKRFYTTASIVETAVGWEVQLDGKPIKTVGGATLTLTHCARAGQVAREWNVQGETLDKERMIATRLANIAIDRVPADRGALIADMMNYADTDLLCYRAPEMELASRQAEAWDAPLAFLETQCGIRMVTTQTLGPIPQPQASLDALRALLEAADNETLAALAFLTPLLGSLLLTVALWRGGVSVEDGLAAARVDEDFQQERWGADAEASAAWESKTHDITQAVQWLLFRNHPEHD